MSAAESRRAGKATFSCQRVVSLNQIGAVFKEHDACDGGVSGNYGMHADTLRLRKASYGEIDAAELARLKQGEDGNSRTRRIIANQTLEIDAIETLSQETGGVFTTEAAMKALMAEGLVNGLRADSRVAQDIDTGTEFAARMAVDCAPDAASRRSGRDLVRAE